MESRVGHILRRSYWIIIEDYSFWLPTNMSTIQVVDCTLNGNLQHSLWEGHRATRRWVNMHNITVTLDGSSCLGDAGQGDNVPFYSELYAQVNYMLNKVS